MGTGLGAGTEGLFQIHRFIVEIKGWKAVPSLKHPIRLAIEEYSTRFAMGALEGTQRNIFDCEVFRHGSLGGKSVVVRFNLKL